MDSQVKKFLHLPLLVGGIAATLVSGIVIVSLAFSGQESKGVIAPAEASETAALPAIEAPAARPYRCDECGVIESTREIKAPDEKTAVKSSGSSAAGKRGEFEAKPLRNYEITIRLRDGSMRVITDPKPAQWRHGEPVTIIAGVN
ncbi:MAG: hypothetical protein ACTS6J_15735 [Burkholderiales bacterium]